MTDRTDFPAVMVVDGEMAAHHWLLEQEEMVLGRDETCDMVIPIRQISRQHIVFRRVDDGKYVIEDLGSKNGTWLNGNRVEGMREVRDGDEIHVALKVRLRFLGSGVTAPNTEGLPDKVPSMAEKGRLKIDVESRQVFILGVELD